jgi:hypothetical protein
MLSPTKSVLSPTVFSCGNGDPDGDVHRRAGQTLPFPLVCSIASRATIRLQPNYAMPASMKYRSRAAGERATPRHFGRAQTPRQRCHHRSRLSQKFQPHHHLPKAGRKQPSYRPSSGSHSPRGCVAPPGSRISQCDRGHNLCEKQAASDTMHTIRL